MSQHHITNHVHRRHLKRHIGIGLNVLHRIRRTLNMSEPHRQRVAIHSRQMRTINMVSYLNHLQIIFTNMRSFVHRRLTMVRRLPTTLPLLMMPISSHTFPSTTLILPLPMFIKGRTIITRLSLRLQVRNR